MILDLHKNCIMIFERNAKNTIIDVSKTFPVVLVSGPRQVGKSTLLNSIADKSRKIVSLDNPSIRALAKTDPELFLQRYSPPVLIDEVQYAPELFPFIKIIVDERKRPGDFWLTGSQMFKLMKNVTESLAGRVGIVPLLGLSNSEICNNNFDEFEVNPDKLIHRLDCAKRMDINEVFERIFKGSFPHLYEVENVNLNIYFESYLETYLSRDVRELEQVGNETAFLKFIKVVAARTGTVLNYETLAQETEISSPTAKHWLSILISSGIVTLVEPFSSNALKRVIKSPRMYFLDTGLCAYLMGWENSRVLENSSVSGEFFETWIVSEIVKSYLNRGKKPPLYYYRDSNKKEIDLVLYKNGIAYPIEIKKSANPVKPTKNFNALDSIEADNKKVGTGAVICMAGDVFPLDRNNWYVPAWII